MTEYAYEGKELELFARATNWKAYLKRRIDGYLGERVLEVGAGVGATTRMLANPRVVEWLCVEPDAAQADEIQRAIGAGTLPGACRVARGTIRAVPPEPRYQTILYIDVLEHIEDDLAELNEIAARLDKGGRFIAVCPAHQWLFSPFDRAIGHWRRYNRRLFQDLRHPELTLTRVEYLDSFGMLASAGNRLLLRKAMPAAGDIAFWDGVLVPLSRLFDPLTGRRLGKSILGVWQK